VIVFMCQHGAAKSVVAAAYFNRTAEREGLPHRAVAFAAETPWDAVPENVSALLTRDGFSVDAFKPRHVAAADLESAAKVVAIGCECSKSEACDVAIEQWNDIPEMSVDLPASAAAIRKHVEKLVQQLKGP